MINLGLVGFGTVGTAVIKILQSNIKLIENKIGDKIRIKKICDVNISSKRDVKINKSLLTTDVNDILNDNEIDIVIELIGAKEIAYNTIIKSIQKGKHVVTANKAVISTHWNEIFSLANKNKVLVYFEASVAAGVPVIQGLNEGLASNRIKSISGILNGTTNFILTKMSEDNVGFGNALAQAQKAGFAEANPKMDIEGIDASQKLSILASLAYGDWINPDKIYREGITNVNISDIRYAREEFGLVIKLVGTAKEVDGKIFAQVRPTLIPREHPFANVKNEYNAVSITGDSASDIMYYGKGAGGMAAASAVVSDIIFLSRHVVNDTAGKLPYVLPRLKKVSYLPTEKVQGRYYLRFTTVDRPGVLSKISGILGKHNVSIASCFQEAQGNKIPIIMLTHTVSEGNLRNAVSEINKLPIVKDKTVIIQVML